jgi:anti-sigma factor RsiW
MDSLEDYLAGALKTADRQRIEAHLDQCEMCREEVAAMQDVGLLLGGLRSSETVEPAAGFYARVMQQVEAKRPVKAAPSFANLFAFDLAMGRRLAFACLMTLAIMGFFLVSRETSYSSSPSPESVMAQQESPAFGHAQGHDAMLLTLTAYEH